MSAIRGLACTTQTQQQRRYCHCPWSEGVLMKDPSKIPLSRSRGLGGVLFTWNREGRRGKAQRLSQRSKKVCNTPNQTQTTCSELSQGRNQAVPEEHRTLQDFKDTGLKSILDFTCISVFKASTAKILSRHSARHSNGTKGGKPSVTTLWWMQMKPHTASNKFGPYKFPFIFPRNLLPEKSYVLPFK